MHMYTQTHTYTRMRVHAHPHIHAHVHTHTRMHVHAHTHTSMHRHTHTHTHTHTYTHTHKHSFIHTHTHTHNSLTHSLTHAHTDAFIHLRCLFVCSCIAHTFSFHWNTELVNLMAWLDLTWPDVAGRGRSSCVTWRSMCRSKVFKWSKPGHWLTQTVKRSVYLQLTVFVDHIALLPQMRGCLLGMGTGGGREWRLDHEYHPKKTGETMDRRQNNRSVKECPLAIAQRLVHCAIAVSTAVLGRVTRTMSVALLLRNNPKRKKSNSRSPAPPPCSWSLLGYNLRVQLHLSVHDLTWNPVK